MGSLTKRRGRPPLVPGQRSVTLSVAVEPAFYDALLRYAALTREELAPAVRRLLRRSLPIEVSNEQQASIP